MPPSIFERGVVSTHSQSRWNLRALVVNLDGQLVVARDDGERRGQRRRRRRRRRRRAAAATGPDRHGEAHRDKEALHGLLRMPVNTSAERRDGRSGGRPRRVMKANASDAHTGHCCALLSVWSQSRHRRAVLRCMRPTDVDLLRNQPLGAVFYCTRGRAWGRASACDNSTDPRCRKRRHDPSKQVRHDRTSTPRRSSNLQVRHGALRRTQKGRWSSRRANRATPSCTFRRAESGSPCYLVAVKKRSWRYWGPATSSGKAL